MQKLYKTMMKLIRPPAWLAVLITIPSFALLIYVFAKEMEETAWAYLSYGASAYSFAVICAYVPCVVRAFRTGFERYPKIQRVLDAEISIRYRREKEFRQEISLYAGMGINLLYALMKMVSCLAYHSPWFGALAVYYAMLAVLKYAMIRYIRRHSEGQNVIAEWKRYRLCGIVLLTMNQTLAAVVYMVVREDYAIKYPDIMIYAVAAYTFYTVITAVLNLIRTRNDSRPILAAGKAINLVAAMVSLLILETAMLAQFGSPEDVLFERIVTGATGAAVCAGALAMAAYMIIRSTGQIRRLRRAEFKASGHH